jgi:TDG/mug DNA glycosylase family protein
MRSEPAARGPVLEAPRPRTAHVQSFPPIKEKDAEVLVLGSMPGLASLKASQYYAHPQNAFWRIIAELLQFDPAIQYPARIKQLQSARIALWDVLQSCKREGSLDSSIERDSQVPNDFRAFFRKHRKIARVYFNGAEAEACFNRHVLADASAHPISYVRLPSTSPANASFSFAQKLRAWRVILDA